MLLEAIALAAGYKEKAIRAKCSLSSNEWRSFCIEQLSRNVGARILHRFTNRHNAPQPVQMFKNSSLGVRPNTPNEAVEQDASHWRKYWQCKCCDRTAHDVLAKLRQSCRSGVGMESSLNHNFAPTFTTKCLFNSAEKYKKVSKGSDHWLASELCLPDVVLDPIAHSIDEQVVALAWAHQSLLNLHPELGKDAGGFRTISKTPKLYRRWVRTRKSNIDKWEKTLDKPYDTACKGSSALIAAAHRAIFSEIAVRNGYQVCGSFFDMAKFFDTVQPAPLYDAFIETHFPLIDAVMGLQIHLALLGNLDQHGAQHTDHS